MTTAAVSPNELFAAMTQERRREVIKRALDARKTAPRDAEESLNYEINQALMHMRGSFRDKARAPVRMLVTELDSYVTKYHIMALALLDVWSASLGELRSAVEAAIEARSSSMTAGEDVNSELLNSNTGYEKPDIDLMVGYFGSISDGSNDAGVESDEVVWQSEPAFPDFLARLEALPPDAPEWMGGIPTLISRMAALTRDKENEMAAQGEIAEWMTRLADEHGETLGFLGWDISSWATEGDHVWTSTERVGELTDKISLAIAEYAQVPDRGATLSAERTLRSQREELEGRVLAALEDLSALRLPKADMGIQPVNESAEADRKTIDKLREQVAERDEKIKRLNRDNSRFERENTTLQENKETLTGERNEWRARYSEESKRNGSEPVEPPQSPTAVAENEVGSVVVAVDLARQHLSHRLDIALNSRSDYERLQFARPYEVWQAFEWLSDAYYRSRNREIANMDYIQSLKEKCSWDYVGNQARATVAKFQEEYTTQAAGKKFALREHIGKGRGRPDTTIRIAFAWDSERQMVIVGYVGRHQRTDAS